MRVGDTVKVTWVLQHSPQHLQKFVGKTGKVIKKSITVTTNLLSVKQKVIQHQVLFDDNSSWIFVDNEVELR